MTRNRLYLIITFFFLISQVFPPIGLILPFGEAVNIAVFVGLSILMFPSIVFHKTMLVLLAYGLLTFVYYIGGNAFFGSFDLVIVPFLSMYSSMFIFEYTLKYNDHVYTKWVVLLIVALNLIMAVISIPQLIVNPNLIRLIDAQNSASLTTSASGYRFLTQYATLHGIPLLIGPLIILARKLYARQKSLAIFILVATVSLYVLLALANVATAFLVATLSLFVGLFFRFESFTRNSIIKLGFAAVLGLLLLRPGVIVPTIDFVQDILIEEGATHDRLEELKNSVIYGDSEGDLQIRQDLYTTSKDLFWESPLLGTPSPELISRHTWFWDRLACFGIFFFIPVILVFVFHFKKAYRSLFHTKVTYFFGALLLILMLYYKNEFGIGTWLYGFCALPLICRYIDYIESGLAGKRQIDFNSRYDS